VKIAYRQAASEDVVRQFRYYLVTVNLPEVAIRFRDAFRRTMESLRQHPFVGPRYPVASPELRDLRSWPVVGFEAIRIYYLLQEGVLQVIRVLHGKHDVKAILDREEPPSR
jgi:toxin ParE1/3/4